jgi:transmembrane sensor
MNSDQATQLLQRFREGATTPEETIFVQKWYDELVATSDLQWTAEEKEMYRSRIFMQLEAQSATPVRSLKSGRSWLRWAAAAALILGIGAYLWYDQTNLKTDQSQIAKSDTSQNDVQPGGHKATLTLADGSKIILDEALNGQISAQNGSLVIKKADGRIEYQPTSDQARNDKIVFNTMSTPRGGQYQLTLPDGSQVWLNAASSITYPTAFAGKNRTVSITGEVYFEVTKDPSQPFIVKTAKDQIEVLGTAFNVNAYEDEAGIKTSLLEGSVKIGEQTLEPGHALLNGKILMTNVAQDIAWKNGVFDFHKLPLDQVMRQLARWYDITVIYENGASDIRVGGSMGRDLNLSQVLKILSDMQVKYRLDGKTLTIL